MTTLHRQHLHLFSFYIASVFILSKSLFPVECLDIHFVGICLHPNRTFTAGLSCPPDSRIRIVGAVHSWQNQTLVGDRCGSDARDACNRTLDDLAELLDTCSGVVSCLISSAVWSYYELVSCGMISDYIQVTYQCINVTVMNFSTVHDICGSVNTSGMASSFGFITSFEYPEYYYPNTRCTCTLSTPTGGGQIFLRLIDYGVAQQPNSIRQADWLEYTKLGQSWGDGFHFTSASTNIIQAGVGTVSINFNTDDRNEARGFWLEYSGRNMNKSQDVLVDIKCSYYKPPAQRWAIGCYQAPNLGELYMSCTSFGVIDILQVRTGSYGSYVNISNAQCDANSPTGCLYTFDGDIPEIWNQCMMQTICTPPVRPVNITGCTNKFSDHTAVEYQCIKVDGEVGSNVDICGYAISNGAAYELISGSGYLTTPNYPSDYPPDSSCFCRLEVPPVAQIFLYMLDLRLSSSCTYDWLEYTVADETPGNGTKLCSTRPNQTIHTNSSIVSVNFHSSQIGLQRGFWMRYYGKMSNGGNSPIRVECGSFQYNDAVSWQTTSNVPQLATVTPNKPHQTATNKGLNEEDPADDTRTSKIIIGVVIGLSLLLLSAMLVLALFLFRHHRRSKSRKIRQLKPGIDVVSNGKASSVVSTSSDPMSTPSGGGHCTKSTPSGGDNGTMLTPSRGDHGTKSTPAGGDHGTMSTPSGGDHGTMSTLSGGDHGTMSTPSGGDHGTMSTPSGGEHDTSIDSITTVYDNRSYNVD